MALTYTNHNFMLNLLFVFNFFIEELTLVVFLAYNPPIPPIPIPRPPEGIEWVEWPPDWIVGLPLGLGWTLGIIPLLIILLNLYRNRKIKVNLRQCTVIMNGLKIRAVYDKCDPMGIGLRLYYNSHPSLEGRYITLPCGKVVFAYILIGAEAAIPPLSVIQDILRAWGSLEHGIDGSASFPWPLPGELIRLSERFDLTTGEGPSLTYLTYQKYITDNLNNMGPPGHITVPIYFSFSEYWFFSARIVPMVD